jgi:hypothetical protein
MTFDQVADVVGGLPPSAYRYRQRWENDRSHVQEAARICRFCRHEFAAASG